MSEEPLETKGRVVRIVAAVLLIMALVAGGGFLIGTYIINPSPQSASVGSASTVPIASSLRSPAR